MNLTRLIGVTLVFGGIAAGALAWQPADKQPEPAPAPKEQLKKDAAPAPAKEEYVYVSMKTSMGEIIIELDAGKAPISTQNFLSYAEKGHYDGTIFHRVIADFMIQGGGFTPDMKQKPTAKAIKNEWQNGLKNKRGTIAMARLGDDKPNPSTVDSATSQFFINVKDNGFLDMPQRDGGAYAVFGKVVSGMDVVDKIRVARTGMKSGYRDVPMETVTIEKVKRLTDEEAAKYKGGDKK